MRNQTNSVLYSPDRKRWKCRHIQVNSMINAAVVTMFDEARKIAKDYDRQLQELPDEKLDDVRGNELR